MHKLLKILLLVTLLPFMSCAQNFHVNRGAHDFRPIDGNFIPHKARGYEWTIRFDKTCFYNWLPDQDQYDTNKGGGVTKAFTSNLDQTVLWGWRPSVTKDGMEVYCYVNLETHSIIQSTLVTVPFDSTYVVRIEPKDGTWHYNGINTFVPVPKLIRRTGLWFGGNNNAPGPHGGVAPHKMHIYVKARLL